MTVVALRVRPSAGTTVVNDMNHKAKPAHLHIIMVTPLNRPNIENNGRRGLNTGAPER